MNQEDSFAIATRSPDFAHCVDIHRKPGYDPVELFLDPAIRFPTLKIVGKLLRKKLGFRMLMDVIPLDASLVKGSHGRIPENVDEHPVLITPNSTKFAPTSPIRSESIYEIIRQALTKPD